MSPDTERSVREQSALNSKIAGRAARYLDHLEIGRVLQLPDTKERIEKLLPYFVKGARQGLKSEARDGIVACGEAAGPYLLKLLSEPISEQVKEEVILIFGEIKYHESVNALIEILDEQDRFWSTQSLDPGWWNSNVESEETKARRDSYGLIFDAVHTLGQLRGSRARAAVEQTKERWEAINFENPQIVEECEEALKAMGAEPK